MEEAIGERIYDFIKQISKLQTAADFREPVDPIKYGCFNYYDIIEKPMDLLTLKENLLNGKYNTLT